MIIKPVKEAVILGRDISIAISARDNYSSAITTMRNANQHFNKDLEGLTNKLDKLNDTKISLKVDTDKARTSLRDAEKQFKLTGDAADELALKLANEGYENARRNLDLVSKNARQAEKDILNLTDVVSRSENRVSGIAGSNGNAESGMMKSLAGAGLGKMAGDAVSGAINAGIGSAFGDAIGNAISTTLSGAMTGAAIGSIVPGIGTAVGAVVGAAAGGISAATQYFQKEDDYFKAYRNEVAGNALQDQQNALASGIDVYMGREQTGVQLKHQFGDEENAGEYLDKTIALANQTPFFYKQLVGVGSIYKSFGYANENLYEEQKRIADAAAIRGWETSDMEQVAQNLGYMSQSGDINKNYVRQLQMRGINVPRYLAIAGSDLGEKLSDEDILSLIGASDDELKARGISLSESDIYEMISKGGIDGKKAARTISDYMSLEFEGGAAKLADTYYGLFNTLGGWEEQMQSAMGEGYAEERKKGLAEQINWFSKDGEEQEKANRMIGQWQAQLDNQKEQMERDMMSAIMNNNTNTLADSNLFSEDIIGRASELSREYQSALAENDGAEMGRILAQAKIDAQIAYESSDGAIALQDMQTKLHIETTNTLAGNKSIIDAHMHLGEATSEGFLAGYRRNLEKELPGIIGNENSINGRRRDSSDNMPYSENPRSQHYSGKAFGLPYVPYDNYITRLHEGERVLTASEARAQDSRSSAAPIININNPVVREEPDIDKIARALATGLYKAHLIS